jgi:DNA-binding MarR family transcriptional regulator
MAQATTAEHSSSTDAASARSADVAAVASQVIDVVRAFAKAKVRMLQDAEHDVDRAAHLLLRSIESNGAMRVSALAACVGSDVSTVSRQVSALVKEGLLERRADPGDSRASLLVPTSAGRAVIARHYEIRAAFFERMLVDWSGEEVRQFGTLLERFGRAYQEAVTPESPDPGAARLVEAAPPTRPTQSGGANR